MKRCRESRNAAGWKAQVLAIFLCFLWQVAAHCTEPTVHMGVCPCRPLAGVAGWLTCPKIGLCPTEGRPCPCLGRREVPTSPKYASSVQAPYEFDLEGPQMNNYEGGEYSALLRAYSLPPTLEQTVASLPFCWGASCPRGPCCMAQPVVAARLLCIR